MVDNLNKISLKASATAGACSLGALIQRDVVDGTTEQEGSVCLSMLWLKRSPHTQHTNATHKHTHFKVVELHGCIHEPSRTRYGNHRQCGGQSEEDEYDRYITTHTTDRDITSRCSTASL